MKVLKSWEQDADLKPSFNLFMKGHIVKGITLASEDDIDLFCVTRNQRMVRDLVDTVVSNYNGFVEIYNRSMI